MSRSTSESHSPSKSHSRNREAAVAAIIDSLLGSTLPLEPDSQDQAIEPSPPDLGNDSECDSAPPAQPARAPSDLAVEPPPPPPPPDAGDHDSTALQAPHLMPADEPPPPPTDQTEPAVEPKADEAPPPPPPPDIVPGPAVEPPPPKAKADFASSSAMVKDILSADPDQAPDEKAANHPGPKQDPVASDQPTEAPVSSDFFTSAKQKRRRWRLKRARL
jgi:hypothetical protein